MTKNISKILFLVKNPNCAYSRYRCRNIIESLGNSKKYSGSIGNEYESSADIVVFGRQSLGLKNLYLQIRHAKKDHKIIVFDIDDKIFSYRDIPYIVRHDEESPIFWFLYILRIKYLLHVCDVTTSTNQFLADKLFEVSNKPSFVIPNSLNTSQIEASAKNKKSEIFSIGYFSGSSTHTEDLALITESLVKFLKKHNETKLFLINNINLPEELKKYSSQIIQKSEVDYIKLQDYYASVSVNLAPLVENDFTNCKSELKFFEAAIAETTTLASPTFAFKNSIIDSKTGFLCTGDEWYDRLEYLYSHPEENRKIARAAKKYCLEHYYGEKILKTIEDVYDEILKQCKK